MSQTVVSELVSLLTLERLEDNLFRGQSRDIGTKYVFGGQVLGQSLSASQQTVAADPFVQEMARQLGAFVVQGSVRPPAVAP